VDLGIGVNIRVCTIKSKKAGLPAPGAPEVNSFFFQASVGFDL
jgi:hypothetical protein